MLKVNILTYSVFRCLSCLVNSVIKGICGFLIRKRLSTKAVTNCGRSQVREKDGRKGGKKTKERKKENQTGYGSKHRAFS